MLRLWTIVFTGNVLGTLLVAALMSKQVILSPEQLAAALKLSSKLE